MNHQSRYRQAARSERISQISSEPYDIIVIGGGIHGACLAKLAAHEKYKVLLLEKSDYASGTSSRSSKMAHGGLRYLEMFDFEQVFEGIKAREELFLHCPNLVTPEHFLIPVPRNAWWLRAKLSVGLYLYDLMVSNRSRKHRWIPKRALSYPTFHSSRDDLMGCFQYTDGLMNDTRLVIECVVAASHYGATCLNYASVRNVEQDSSNSGAIVRWTDELTGAEHSTATNLVVNCAGPWAPNFDPEKVSSAVRYSRGSHLLFSVPWNEPSLFLPLDQRGRYYFVWPHAHGTLVGTTEREVNMTDDDPQPSPDEVEEILLRLARDLPGSKLSRETLIYAFAGVRTLPVRSTKKGVSRLSRKHIWHWSGSILTLLGGKYTTFAWTASEGLKEIARKLGRGLPNYKGLIDDLPSSLTSSERNALYLRIHSEKPNISSPALQRAIARLGGQVEAYSSDEEAWREIAPGVLMVEALHALTAEHAETIDDVIRRRLDLEASFQFGEAAVSEIRGLLSQRYPETTINAQIVERSARLGRLNQVLKGRETD